MSLEYAFTRHWMVAVTVVGAMLAAGPLGLAQSTQPDAGETAKDGLVIHVWTCSVHGKFHLRDKGACPACAEDLVRKEITLQGPEQVGDPYPLDICIVSGLRLGDMGPPIVMMHEGREVRLCSKDCISKFEADAATYFTKIDQKIVEQQLPRYPMTSCPVSEQALGSMGDPVNRVYNNRLVRFCCNGCVRAFKKDPAKFLPKLDEAIVAQQQQDYPLATCMISGMKLGSKGKPVDYIAANRLVRFCCNGCPRGFWKDPATYLAKLDEAWQEKLGDKPSPEKDTGENDEHNHDHGDHDH